MLATSPAIGNSLLTGSQRWAAGLPPKPGGLKSTGQNPKPLTAHPGRRGHSMGKEGSGPTLGPETSGLSIPPQEPLGLAAMTRHRCHAPRLPPSPTAATPYRRACHRCGGPGHRCPQDAGHPAGRLAAPWPSLPPPSSTSPAEAGPGVTLLSTGAVAPSPRRSPTGHRALSAVAAPKPGPLACVLPRLAGGPCQPPSLRLGRRRRAPALPRLEHVVGHKAG